MLFIYFIHFWTHSKQFHLLKQGRLVYCSTTRCRCFAIVSLNKPQRWEDDAIGLKPAVASIYSFIIATTPAGAAVETSCHGAKAGFQPGRAASLLQGHRERQAAWSWELKGSENPLRNRKSKQTPHRKAPGLGMEPTTFTA